MTIQYHNLNFLKFYASLQNIMNQNKNSKPSGMMENVVEEELCRQAFGLFDKSGSGTILKTVCLRLLVQFISFESYGYISYRKTIYCIISKAILNSTIYFILEFDIYVDLDLFVVIS